MKMNFMVTVLYTLLSSSVVFAQTEQNQPQNDTLATTPAEDSAFVQESIGVESSMPVPPEVQALSNDDKKKKAEEFLQEMRKTLEQVLSVLEEARNNKDIVRMNSINEKLTQIKGLLRISEQAEVSMKEAIAKGETKTAEHEFMKIQISSERVRNLQAEAESSSGELAVYAGDTQLEINIAEGSVSNGTNSYFAPDGSITPEMQTRLVQTVNNTIQNTGTGGGTTTKQTTSTGGTVLAGGGGGGGGGGGSGGVIVSLASPYEAEDTTNDTNKEGTDTSNNGP